eukprot:8639134-Alexandrium_andersonii.AAC.1
MIALVDACAVNAHTREPFRSLYACACGRVCLTTRPSRSVLGDDWLEEDVVPDEAEGALVE